MPTYAEMSELFDSKYTTWTSKKLNSVSGYQVTSKTNGNSIFLPLAGCRLSGSSYNISSLGFYWCSSLNSSKSNYADYLYFYSEFRGLCGESRYMGHSIRPVYSRPLN